uniref:Synaptotagmin-4-like n=1 Tax=Saccoglossus kowalevskii TaxID=10224 RepID=A0ABM0LTY3_SACKO|nr:PREDICTED: synaptotagmin-4-like [Saccoglossus kowalevskii]
MTGEGVATVYLQYSLGASAAVLLFALFFGCAVCWHKKRQRKVLDSETIYINKKAISGPRGSDTPPVRRQSGTRDTVMCGATKATSGPELFLFDTLRQINERSETRRLSSFGSLPSPGIPHSASTSSISSSQSSQPFSPLDLAPLSPQDTSNYSTDFETEDGTADESSSRLRPKLDFNILYSHAESTLVVTVVRVRDLPVKTGSTYDTYVKLYLLPRFQDPLRTGLCRKTTEPEFNEHFQFHGLPMVESEKAILRFKVYTKDFWKKKKKFVGEVIFPCIDADLKSETPCMYSSELNPNRSKAVRKRKGKKRSKGHMNVGHGELFILLQYQAVSNRMKILVRKAENLGKANWIPGSADHHVVINLTNKGKVVESKETRLQSGHSPVWNEPFLFDIHNRHVSNYSLEFILMKGRFYSRHGVVGHVLIGPDTTESGIAHWNEAMQPRARETARWHSILPVSKY